MWLDKYSIAELIRNTGQTDKGQGFFELETPRMLEVNFDGLVWAKAGSMVAYEGHIKFEREGIFRAGTWGSCQKRLFLGKVLPFMKAKGQGKLYLADGGKKVLILELKQRINFC